MKKISLIIIFFVLGVTMVKADSINSKPEKIYSITRVLHSIDYYAEQVELWKREIDKDKKNGNAWHNYYLAARMTNLLNDGSEEDIDLNKIIKEIGEAIPNTFDYHYLTYRNGHSDPTLINHLEIAYKLEPNRVETYDGFVSYYEMTRELEKKKNFNQKWYDSGEISPGIMSWNYNVMMSLEKEAILLTFGDNDTYPLWMLQDVKNVGRNVAVLNIHLLKRKNYRDAVFADYNIAAYDKSEIDFDNNTDFINSIIEHLFARSHRPVYLGISVPVSLREPNSDQLYLVGMAFKYSENSFDNIGILKNNYENRFLTDYLKIDFENEISASVLSKMNLNYLPAFMLLLEHYRSNDFTEKAKELKQIILKIADEGGRKEKVNKLLRKTEPLYRPKAISKISVRTLDKVHKPIGSNKLMNDTEVTNEAYDLFLQDLLSNREFENLEICKIHDTDWRDLLPNNKVKEMPDNIIFKNGYPTDANLPVQNISHEAAQLYCEWITNVYNNSDSKKKKYKKVIFRLPTAVEWEAAFKAGHNSPYPWGGYYYQNNKGCFLANFNVSKIPPCKDCPDADQPHGDGGFFPVIADAYFPNDFGLYNMSGNLAEMIQEEGIARGGSWNDPPSECTVDSVKKYLAPSPEIGFRTIMEVVEQK